MVLAQRCPVEPLRGRDFNLGKGDGSSAVWKLRMNTMMVSKNVFRGVSDTIRLWMMRSWRQGYYRLDLRYMYWISRRTLGRSHVELARGHEFVGSSVCIDLGRRLEISPRYAFVAELQMIEVDLVFCHFSEMAYPQVWLFVTEIPPGSAVGSFTSDYEEGIRCDVSVQKTAFFGNCSNSSTLDCIRETWPRVRLRDSTRWWLYLQESPFIQVTSIGMALEEKEEEKMRTMRRRNGEDVRQRWCFFRPPWQRIFSARRKTNDNIFACWDDATLVHSGCVESCCGRINLLFIKESWTVRESGGVVKFFQQFFTEGIVSFELIVLRWVQTVSYRLKTH